jgi:hypothetical protein
MTTVAFVHTSTHPMAMPFYRQFPLDPIPLPGPGYLTVSQVVPLADKKIETLLQAIIDAKVPKGGAILLVTHGIDQGIDFSLGKGRGMTLHVPALLHLRENVEGRLSDEETAKKLLMVDNKTLKPQVAWLDELKALMAKVQALNLSRVDLRACEVGKSRDTLKRLQWFFNAELCCAPDAHDTYGPLPSPIPTQNEKAWREFLTKYPKAVTAEAGSERYAFGYKVKSRLQVEVAAIATSPKAVDVWARQYLPPKTTTTNVAIAYHGLTPDLINITFAGEAGYRDHLVQVTDGKGPTIVVTDTNEGLPRPGRTP